MHQPYQKCPARPPVAASRWSAWPLPRWPRRAAALVAGLAWAAVAGCGGAEMPKFRDVCLQVEASPNLNLYEGQAHAVTVYLYPLTSPLGFKQASAQDLLGGARPPGMAWPPIPISVSPGLQKEFEFKKGFPKTAAYMGIVADYYREPGDPEGDWHDVVPATCGWFSSPALTLSSQNLFVH